MNSLMNNELKWETEAITFALEEVIQNEGSVRHLQSYFSEKTQEERKLYSKSMTKVSIFIGMLTPSCIERIKNYLRKKPFLYIKKYDDLNGIYLVIKDKEIALMSQIETVRVLKEGFLNGNAKAVSELVHNNISYLKIDCNDLITYYKKEYLLSLFERYDNLSYGIDPILKQMILEEFNEICDKVYSRLEISLETWIVREIQYFISDLIDISGIRGYSKELIGYLVRNEEEKFISLMNKVVGSSNQFQRTNHQIFFNFVRNYNNSHSLPKRAKINYLLNLSHNNGTMAHKIVDISRTTISLNGSHKERVNTILNLLSDQYVVKEVEYEFTKLTGIRI